VGFLVLAGASLATLAAVVLLPPRARLAAARYERDVLAARIADERARIEANDRLLAALPDDVVLTRRLAMSDLNALPRRHQVLLQPSDGTAGPPPTVSVEPAPRPDPPSGWMLSAGCKLARPAYRRGVFLLAVAGLSAAMLLFAPLRSTPSRRTAKQG
jgi:hypothetical protein